MKLVIRAIIIALLLPIAVFAKGGGTNNVGLWLEGTIANVTIENENIHFQLTGRLAFEQYPDGIHRSLINVGCKNVSVTLVQPESFFAMTSDNWRGGSVQKKERLAEILKTAAARNRLEKFELTGGAKINFGKNQNVENVESSIIRVTDWDLH